MYGNESGNGYANEYFTPNQPSCMKSSDSASINAAIQAAAASGCGKVVIPRKNARTGESRWVIDEAILLPDEIEVILDNCVLVQADGCFDNVFRNANLYGSGVRQHGISITGQGNAVIDGGTPNGLVEGNSLKDGMPHISVNNMILLHNVDGFRIDNLTFRNQRWWAVNLLFAVNGKLSNLTFDAKDNIPNQDGIDLRTGCQNIVIENIYGQAGDDLVALSGFLGFEKERMWVSDANTDICNVTIRNVIGTSVTKAVVALRNQDGVRLHDITIDGVYDTSADGAVNRPYAVVRIGQKFYSKVRFSRLGETYGIHVKNVHASQGDAVMLNMTLAESDFNGIYCGKDVKSAVTSDRDWAVSKRGAYLRNVVIENVFCAPEHPADQPLLRFYSEDEESGMENVLIDKIFAPHKGKEDEKVVYSEFHQGVTVGRIYR